MEAEIQQFCIVTGASEETAKNYLTIGDNDLQTAIELFLSESSTIGDQPTTSADKSIRAPIAHSTATLVTESFQTSYAPVRQYRAKDSVFDRFRDFQAEAAEHTALIQASARKANGHDGEHVDDQDIVGNGGFSMNKRKTLESLFRPPLEIMHRGNFDTAKREAVYKKRWLLVNVQNVEEFACQALNRDIWNHQMVKDLITENFILWQIYYDSADGNRFCTYYPIDSYPFVCIIDPQTGQLMKTIHCLSDTMAFCDSIVSFLEQPSVDNKVSCSSDPKNEMPEATQTKPNPGNSKPVNQLVNMKRKANHYLETGNSEDVDMPFQSAEKYTKFDINEGCQKSNGCTNGDCEVVEDWKKFTSDAGQEMQIVFKLPCGKRHLLKIQNKSSLQAIILYAKTELKLPFDSFNYLLNHPRRLLNSQKPNVTLEYLNLNKQEMVYIEEK